MTITDPLVEHAQRMIEHVNDDHSDALLLLLQTLGQVPNANTATAVGLDSYGIDLVAGGDDGSVTGDQAIRIAFLEQATDPVAAQTQMLRLVALARERTGAAELSAVERRVAERELIRTFITRVVAVEQIGPHMVQVTCGGGDLVDFEPLGPDTFVYVLAPKPGRSTLNFDRTFAWSMYDDMPEDDRPVGAYYTVRAWRPERHEMDLVVVTHGVEGEGSRWALRVQVGDDVGVWGPRRVYDPPTATDRYLLVGDETGVHAIAAILETLPPELRVDVIVEVDGPADQVPLQQGPNTSVRWVYRNGEPAGTTSTLLDEVTQLDLSVGRIYAWGGAESRAVTAVRRYLRDDVGMAQDAVAMTGYWRHAMTRADEAN